MTASNSVDENIQRLTNTFYTHVARVVHYASVRPVVAVVADHRHKTIIYLFETSSVKRATRIPARQRPPLYL